MKQLFLTSEILSVARDISTKIKTKSGKLLTAYITTPIEKGDENDDLTWHKENKQSMVDAGFNIFEYTITGKNYEQLKLDLDSTDVIYVEGGSLVHMMNQARLTGFDTLVHEYVKNGGVYIGTSTGSFIASEETAPGIPLETYLEDDFNSKGIGLVNFLVMPHWGNGEFYKAYQQVPSFAYNMKVPMIILTDTQYVWVIGDNFQIIDVSKPTELVGVL